VASWYNGALEESVLMAIKVVTLDPGYDVGLNNAAAILNLGGLEYKAIPILKILVQKYPDNPMVLNNMGQAWAGLGETDTAMYYLSRCIAKSPNNPEANNTAGEIELVKGNREKAKAYFEHSLKGAYSESSSNALHYLDPKINYSKFVRPQVHIPEYFNADKYALPPQCENVGQAAAAKETYKAFKEMIQAAIKKYEIIEKEEDKIAKETVTQKLMVSVNQRHEVPPFFFLASTILVEIDNEMSDDILALDKFKKQYDVDIENLEKEYEKALVDGDAQYAERSEKQGEGNPDPELDIAICKTREGIANRYLLLFSNLRKNWQEKNIAVSKKYLNDRIFWSYLMSIDIHNFRSIFYGLVTDYLHMMNSLCQTKIIDPCHREDADKQKADPLEIKEPGCPIDIEIRFIVGKYSLNCTSVSFSGGEGFVFKYSKNFATRQSTMSLGIGDQLELGGGFGGVHIGAEASLSESLFVKYDGNNNVTAAGLKFDVDVSAGAKFGAGDAIKVKKDLGSVETGVGYTVGIESGTNGFEPGIHFTEGPLQKLLNPQEEPVNKKVPVYKPVN